MASVFTFDPDPPRVASPWTTSAKQSPNPASRQSLTADELLRDFDGLLLADSDDGNVIALEAEPQEGPTEYKLHLLLRPRRSYVSSTTPARVGGSQHFRSPALAPQGNSELLGSSPNNAYSSASRQHRLEQLTTQLLWRLQQSSRYHSSSPSNVILPFLSDATVELNPTQEIAKLLPGLEESKGALYEIGVTDDGKFIGLTKDEMTESLNNLKAMAACLGCSVDILRMVCVGQCEWYDPTDTIVADQPLLKKGRLYVCEAYVKPELAGRNVARGDSDRSTVQVDQTLQAANKEQLRVSLTGATNDGKSSLLGTLSTSTLDNGRGKSRLSLLRHRHEIASGITSSVSQELLGYYDEPLNSASENVTSVVNYGTADISTWTDIHNASTLGRLVFVSDSAGHPRYRRTTVRGLVAWAPHWTLICIAAPHQPYSSRDSAKSGGRERASSDTAAELSMSHLELCLQLNLPLVVVFTKLDIATKDALRPTLSNVLTALKRAGRTPAIMSNDSVAVTEQDLQTTTSADVLEAQLISQKIKHEPLTVPILFTSSVKGTGIRKLHALLRHLPTPTLGLENNNTIETPLFRIDDSFRLSSSSESSNGVIISGHLTSGSIAVGDVLLLGPFSYITLPTAEDPEILPPSNPDDPFLTPRSFNDALAKMTNPARLKRLPPELEWRKVQVVSIRNLRLPVRAIQQDQAGTIGVLPLQSEAAIAPLAIRKGQVLTAGAPVASHSFTAAFAIEMAGSVVVGNLVVTYCATVRASAKVLAVSLQDRAQDELPNDGNDNPSSAAADDEADGFDFDFETDARSRSDDAARQETILVTFQFLTYREFIETGMQVLVMPGGGGGGGGPSGTYGALERGVKGVGSLDSFCGRVVERFG